jgi:hypothetical protein
MSPDTADMTPVNELTDDEEICAREESHRVLTSFRWCAAVSESFQAFDCGLIIGVFLFRIEPRLEGVDDTLWIVVGDLPHAYLVCDDAPGWHCALQCYVREMQRWIDAVRAEPI